jgi:hypothetical protein
VALVRVYCGLASAEQARPAQHEQLDAAGTWLTVAVVDDSGRLLDVCDIGDTPAGYAQLGALLTERSSGPTSVAIAADSDDHLVTMLLMAAGRALAFADDDSVDDFAEQFSDDESVEEMQSPPAERRAVGLARALQAGALSAVALPAPREMAPLKPILAAHAAMAAGRQGAAVALREVLRELYPAALRAYPDPAEAVPLAVLDALPEPGMVSGSAAGRGRDNGAATDAIVGQLVASGVAEAGALNEAITALRVAITETPRRGGVSRSLTTAVARTVREAVAAVRACDSAGAALIGALADRANSPASAPSPRMLRQRPAPAAAGTTSAPTLRSVREATSEYPAIRVPTPRRNRPVGAPISPAPIAPAPIAPAASMPLAASLSPAAPASPAASVSPAASYSSAAAQASPAGAHASPAAHSSPAAHRAPAAPAVPAASTPSAAIPAYPRTPDYPAAPVSPAPRTSPARPVPATVSVPPAPPASPRPPTTYGTSGAGSAPLAEQPRTVPPPPPGITPIAPAPVSPGRAYSPPTPQPAAATANGISPPRPVIATANGTSPGYPQPEPVPSPAPYTPPAQPLPTRTPRAAEAFRTTITPANGDARGFDATDYTSLRPHVEPAPPAAPPGSRANWPLVGTSDEREQDQVMSGLAPDPILGDPYAEAAAPPRRPTPDARVTPPWQADDLPPEPPMLRLVEPPPLADPALRRDEGGTGGNRVEPPALRLIDTDGSERAGRAPARGRRNGPAPISVPPVAEEGDSDLLIFAAARSAWFTGQTGEESTEWGNMADDGWRAAEQASRPSVGAETGAGLPKRVPRANLVPGSPLAAPDRPLRIVRDPASIAEHTSGYFRGYRRGQEINGYAVGGRPGRESAQGWDFSRESAEARQYDEEYEYGAAAYRSR